MGKMGLKETSFVKPHRNSDGITAILRAAACEWFLIFMLLINAILSYLATKFARYNDLQIPCILCSGIHHILRNKKKPGRIYPDAICKAHRSEISRLISCQIHGKLADGNDMCDDCLLSFTCKNKSNIDMQRVILGKLGLEGCASPKNDFMNLHLSGGVSCSCCDKPWKSKTNVQKSSQLPPSGNIPVSKPNIPVPRRLGRRESLKRIRDKISGSTTPRHQVKAETSESMTPHHPKKGEILGSAAIPPRHPGKSGYESMSHVGYTQLKLNSDSDSEFPFSEDDDDAVPESELNQQQNVKNTRPSKLPELISLDDIPPPYYVDEIATEASPHNAKYSRLSELISLANTPPKADLGEVPDSASSEISGTDIENSQIAKHEETLDSLSPAAEAVAKINLVVNNQTCMDNVAEQLAINKLDEVDRNPDEQAHHDDLQTTDRVSVDVIIPRDTESGFEATVDQLKQQIEHDQKMMNDLYKELEEERNAAEIATNEAMAMITRLQEEKAALHMDALQYLRMMEEQAEYDVDALEKANDLLAEKEKEIQDLEAELDYYRIRFPDECMMDEMNFDVKEKSVAVEVNLPNLNDSSKTKLNEISEVKHKPEVLSLWTELEDEKLYISKHLKYLEKKIRKFTHEGTSPDISDSEDSEKAANGDKTSPISLGAKENGSSLPNGIHPVSELSNGLHENQNLTDGHENSTPRGEKEIIALENEISDLNERLEALEGDFNFLEHSFNSVQSGNKGLKFLEEIAHQLQGLRKAVVRTRGQSTS
ncbi:hypothetical protein ACFE04_031382 [Oxalis oulophora]